MLRPYLAEEPAREPIESLIRQRSLPLNRHACPFNTVPAGSARPDQITAGGAADLTAGRADTQRGSVSMMPGPG